MNEPSVNLGSSPQDVPTRPFKGASDTDIQPNCPRCGARLSASACEGLCQKCLLLAGLSDGDAFGEGDADSADEPVGLGRFGDFNLLEEIARGGMGIVYRAKQVSLNRVVAIKMILSSHLASESEIERFYTEAKAAAGLDHQNIVPIFEVGQIDGQHYYVMPFISGENYAQLIADDSLKYRQSVELLEKVARAIEYAHQKEIIHRDLKPANILVDESLQPKITDFGLAKILSDATNRTHSGQLMGTPTYMSPEQAAGEEVTVASDIYSLGAVLYAGLCGRPPFQGDSPLDVVTQVRNKEPVSPRALDPKLPEDLETICLKCLEKNPHKRYSTAAELADELSRFLNGKPIVARPIRKSERTLRWCRRNPVVAGLLAVVTTLIVVGLISVTGLWLQAEDHSRQAESNFRDAQHHMLIAREAEAVMLGERDRAQSMLKRSEENLYLTRVSLAQQKWKDNHVAQARRQLDLCPKALRDWEWYYLQRICNLPTMTLDGDDGAIVSMAIDPAGDRAAGGFRNGRVRIWSLADATLLHTISAHAAPIHSLEFSHDGTALASASVDKTTAVWDVSSGELRGEPRQHAHFGKRVLRIPNTNWFANLSIDGTLDVVDWETGEVMRSTEVSGTPGGLSSDESGRFLVSNSGKFVYVYRLGDQSFDEPTASFEVDMVITDVAMSPSGESVAVTGGSIDPETVVIDWRTQTEKFRLRGHTLQCLRVRFSQDGKTIMTSSRDKSIRVWSAEDGRELHRLRGHGHVVTDAVATADGQRFVSSSDDGTILIWERDRLDIGEQVDVGTMLRSIKLTPDGTRMLLAGWNGQMQVFDAKTRQPLGDIPSPITSMTDLVLSADGQRAYYVETRKSIRVQSLTDLSRPVETLVADIPALSIAVLDDQSNVLVGRTDGLVQNVDVDDPSNIQTLYDHGHTVWKMALSSDEKHLASVDGTGRLIVWDLANKKMHLDLVAHESRVADVIFHPNMPYLATSGMDGRIVITDLNSGEIVHELIGHSFGVTSLAFHPSSARLVSGGNDFAIKLWDLHSGIELLSIESHLRSVSDVEFTGDGQFIDSVDLDGNWVRHQGASREVLSEHDAGDDDSGAELPH